MTTFLRLYCAFPINLSNISSLNQVQRKCEDLVQCVPAKKGHQILYKGYTYVFKTRLQCGSEQWCCTYRQKTVSEEQLPEWVSIYFTKLSEKEHRCNICEIVLNENEKSLALLEHVKTNHKEVYELHKENPEATVGFRIEFLHLNIQDDGDTKGQPVILGEVCEATTEEIIQIADKADETVDQSVVLMPKKKKKIKRLSTENDTRKRSWVWKYFHKMSNIIFKCTLCNVVLSIKGCNTNNMNRHVRTRHPSIYESETQKKRRTSDDNIDLIEVETPYAIKTEEISASDKDYVDSMNISESQAHRHRRSWIWMYFDRISATSAQCKLCNRNIAHGGNATGNMNRHLKMIHHKTGDDTTWVWKVFEATEDDFFECKICQYRCFKFSDVEKSVSSILQHLKLEHGVVSGDQIITGTDDCEEENIVE